MERTISERGLLTEATSFERDLSLLSEAPSMAQPTRSSTLATLAEEDQIMPNQQSGLSAASLLSAQTSRPYPNPPEQPPPPKPQQSTNGHQPPRNGQRDFEFGPRKMARSDLSNMSIRRALTDKSGGNLLLQFKNGRFFFTTSFFRCRPTIDEKIAEVVISASPQCRTGSLSSRSRTHFT